MKNIEVKQDENLFDLKLQLANEFLRNEGIKGIYDVALLQDLINFNRYDKDTHTSRLKAFINAIYQRNFTPPLVLSDRIDEYISFIQKEIFFDQIKIDTEQKIDELLKEYEGTKNFIFRGQREASWRLYNTMQRVWIYGNYENKLKYRVILEKMVEKGKTNHEEAIKKIIGKNHIDSLNDLAILGYLQHHGCPTPLLDWTTSFENALYFATDGVVENKTLKEIGNYISVYFLNKEDVEPGGAASMIDYSLTEEGNTIKSQFITKIAKDEEQRIKMEEHFKDKDIFDREKIEGSGLISHMCKIENMLSIPGGIMYYHETDIYKGIVFSLLNSDNIKNQQGVFMFNASSYKPLEVVALDAYNKEFDSYKFCECYNINKKLVPYIQIRLTELGIKKDIIYPDEGICTKDILSNSINDLQSN